LKKQDHRTAQYWTIAPVARADRAIPNVTFVTTSRTGRIVSMNAAIVLVPAFSVVDREISGTGTGDGRRMKKDRAD
jgi:hypothetical protein